MKKIITIIGSVISLIAILLGLLDETLGFWQFAQEQILGDGWNTWYLNAFGQVSTPSGDVDTLNDNIIMIIISVVILIGSVVALLGAFMDKNAMGIIGSVLMVAGIAYFLYSLGNFDYVQDLLALSGTEKNVFFASDELILDYKWRLGNGFIILFIGVLVALIGSLIRDD